MGKLSEEQIVYIVADYVSSDSVVRVPIKDKDGNVVEVKEIRWDEATEGEISNFQYYLYENNAIDYGYFFLDLLNFDRWLEMHKGVDVCDEIMDIVYKQPDYFFNVIFPKALEFVDLVTSDMNVNAKLDELYLKKKVQLILLNPTRQFYEGGVWKDYLKVSEVNSKYVNQLITIKGTILAISDKMARNILSNYICQGCMEEIKEIPSKPFKCPACGSKEFEEVPVVVWDEVYCLLTNTPEDSINVPVELKCVLNNQLVKMLYEYKAPIGGNVKMCGILRMEKKRKRDVKYKYVFEVMGLEFLDEQESMLDVELSEPAFKKFAKRKDLYEVLKNSVAPTIYGYDEVKEALVLQLFGGTQDLSKGKRGNIHILLVGDFAIGKTKLLMDFMKVAPNARYVSCISATGRGLTAVVTKEEGMGWVVKLGPVILAHKGFALLDELDKIDNKEVSYLGDILESQKFSLSKGGVKSEFTVEVSVLAAANPKYGRFDDYSDISSNIDMDKEILSRFDLIFALRDVVDTDEEYVKKMQKIYLEGSEEEEVVDPNFLKSYVWYARTHVFPKLTKEALEYLDKFYINMRKKFYQTGTYHFDRRRRDVLIRLAEASARARLSNEATIEDVDRAIKVMLYFLKTIAYDPTTNTIDVDVIIGKPKSKRDKYRFVDKVMDELADSNGEVHIADLYDVLLEHGYTKDEISEIIDMKQRNGEWCNPRPGVLKKVD